MSFVPAHHLVVPEKAAAACSLLSHQGTLLLAWTARDGKLNVVHAPPGGAFGDKRTFKHRSVRTDSVGDSDTIVPMAPALAATTFGVQLAWTNQVGRINLLPLGAGTDDPSVFAQKTLNEPALAVSGPELYVGWTGTDRRLNVARSAGGPFGEPWTLDERSNRRPSLVVTGADVHVAWLGGDRRINVLSTRGAAPPHKRLLEATSSHGPTLVAWGDRLVLVWAGSDRQVNVAFVDGDGLSGHLLVPGATTSHSPAAVVHDGHLVVCWTGGDNRPNLVWLAPAPAPAG